MVHVVFIRGMGSDDELMRAEVGDDVTVGTLNCLLKSNHFRVGPNTMYVEEGPMEDKRSFRSTQTDAKLYPHGAPDPLQTVKWRIVLSLSLGLNATSLSQYCD